MNILIVLIGILLIFVILILKQLIKSNRISVIKLILSNMGGVEGRDEEQWLKIIESLMTKWMPNESKAIQAEIEKSVKERRK